MAHVYERGQIVVPKYFRDLLGWAAGSKLSFSVENDALLVRKSGSIKSELEEFAKKANVKHGNKADFDDEYDKYFETRFRSIRISTPFHG